MLVARPLPATHIIFSVFNQVARLVRNSSGGELEGFQIRGADEQWLCADDKI
jgi:hypothetical protein